MVLIIKYLTTVYTSHSVNSECEDKGATCQSSCISGLFKEILNAKPQKVQTDNEKLIWRRRKVMILENLEDPSFIIGSGIQIQTAMGSKN